MATGGDYVLGCRPTLSGPEIGSFPVFGYSSATGNFSSTPSLSPPGSSLPLVNGGLHITEDSAGHVFLIDVYGHMYVRGNICSDKTQRDMWLRVAGTSGAPIDNCSSSVAAVAVDESSPPLVDPSQGGTLFVTDCSQTASGDSGMLWATFLDNAFCSDGYAFILAPAEFIPLPGHGVKLAVDWVSGAPWYINAAGDIFQWNGTDWTKEPGCAFDIADGYGGTEVVGCEGASTGPGNAVFVWTPIVEAGKPGGWTHITGSHAWQISLDPSGRLWQVDLSSAISYWVI
jgi:hypothetical protein